MTLLTVGKRPRGRRLRAGTRAVPRNPLYLGAKTGIAIRIQNQYATTEPNSNGDGVAQ